MYKKNELLEQNKPQIFNIGKPNFIQKNKQQQNSFSNQQQSSRTPVNNAKFMNTNDLLKEKIDFRRINRAKFQFEGTKYEQVDQQVQRKQAVKMNLFRQSARQQQRQFHQQNHEYLRMFAVIANSATNMEKFKINFIREGGQLGNNKGQNKTNKLTQNYSTVHLQLHIELTSSLINYKFPVKDTYNIVPFKKESIQFESRQLLDPKFEFFVFEKSSQKIEEVRDNLKNVLQQGLTSEFKGTVIRTIGNLDYFEFLDLINNRNISTKSKGIQYPRQIVDIARQNEVFQLNSDEQELYNRTQIAIQQEQTDERMVSCEEFDLQQTAPSVYFEVVQDYSLYKKYRSIEFKSLKIYDKDISINTDIRNIISSQKIYLIELMKELDLYNEMATHQADIQIMKEVSKQLKRKSQQFLRLLCGYTESKILKQYNIENYHEKISMFIEKSIKYNKEIQNLDIKVLQQFPILKIWYQIPKVLFGYSRQKLHYKYYDLVKAALVYEQKIKNMDLQRQLSIKRPNIKYVQ